MFSRERVTGVKNQADGRTVRYTAVAATVGTTRFWYKNDV